jgi:metal-responsive CopG/Arc/MetJ family transcriptional regulator
LRTHIILPDRLIEEIDGLVGKRKRSRFVEEAIREKLKRGALLKAIKNTAGMLPAEEYPAWETSDKAAEWVRESRQGDVERLGKSWRE